MKLRNIIYVLAVGVLLFGCAGTQKIVQKEKDNLPDRLFRSESLSLADTTGNMAVADWKELFTDPFLVRLIDTALVYNSDLRIAGLRVEEAQQALKVSRLAYLPSFGIAPNGAVSNFDGGKSTWVYSAPVTASWQLDLFGGLTNAKRGAKASYDVAVASAQAVRSNIIAVTANMYYTLLMLDEQLDIAVKTEKSWAKNVETVKIMMDAGMSNEVAVSQMEANYYAICTTVNDLRKEILLVENSLCEILLKEPGSIERGRLDNQKFPQKLYVGLPADILVNRPDVVAAEKSLLQSLYYVRETKAGLFPGVTLSGSGGWTNSVGSMIVNPGKLLLSAAASLFQPLFQSGQLRARHKIAQYQFEERSVDFCRTVLNAGNEVNRALAECQNARADNIQLEKQVNSLVKAVESTKLLMQYGSTTYLDVLVAEQALLQAKMSLASNRFSEIQGVINLYQALGGGK